MSEVTRMHTIVKDYSLDQKRATLENLAYSTRQPGKMKLNRDTTALMCNRIRIKIIRSQSSRYSIF